MSDEKQEIVRMERHTKEGYEFVYDCRWTVPDFDTLPLAPQLTCPHSGYMPDTEVLSCTHPSEDDEMNDCIMQLNSGAHPWWTCPMVLCDKAWIEARRKTHLPEDSDKEACETKNFLCYHMREGHCTSEDDLACGCCRDMVSKDEGKMAARIQAEKEGWANFAKKAEDNHAAFLAEIAKNKAALEMGVLSDIPYVIVRGRMFGEMTATDAKTNVPIAALSGREFNVSWKLKKAMKDGTIAIVEWEEKE